MTGTRSQTAHSDDAAEDGPDLKLTTTASVRRFQRLYIATAALNAALEMGLFQRLDEAPASASDLAAAYAIPPDRCRRWLELLAGLGLLDEQDGDFRLTDAAKEAIVDAYSQPTWALLAQEARERYLIGHDLVEHITHPESVLTSQGIAAPDYVAAMLDDPDRAERFTRMLRELHAPLAKRLADELDLAGVAQLMDVGGGSGVMSHALLRRHADLHATVIDIDTVCAVGRTIAAEAGLAERITYHAANILTDELPRGFDAVLQCDVGIFTIELFRRLHDVLKPGGRLIVVDWIRAPGDPRTLQRCINAFRGSLEVPTYDFPTVDDLHVRLRVAGFEPIESRILRPPALHEIRGIAGPTIIEAHRPRV